MNAALRSHCERHLRRKIPANDAALTSAKRKPTAARQPRMPKRLIEKADAVVAPPHRHGAKGEIADPHRRQTVVHPCPPTAGPAIRDQEPAVAGGEDIEFQAAVVIAAKANRNPRGRRELLQRRGK